MRTLKKRLISLLLLMLLLCLPACSQAQEQPVEGLTGLGLYNEFIAGMTSGELHKTHYEYDTWFHLLSSESTQVKFGPTEDGGRKLLCRTRSPFVFWYYPAYDYYDGSTYYYRYQGSWYVDTAHKYTLVQKPDFVGIRERFFTGNTIVSDSVFPHGSGYRLETKVQSPGNTVHYDLLGYTDQDFQFSKIIIETYTYDGERGEFVHTDTYRFRYSHVNEGRPVSPPRGLNPSEVVQ